MEAHNSYSEETAGIIDEEVHKIIETAHARAVELLTSNRKVLDNMARVLVERETIYTDEVDMLLDGASVEDVYRYMDTKEKAAEENPFKRFVHDEPADGGKPAVSEDVAKVKGDGTGSSGEGDNK